MLTNRADDPHNHKLHQLGIVMAITTAIVFGVYPAAMRAAYAHGANASFMVIAATWSRALMLTFFCVIKGKALFQTRRDFKSAVTGGFFQAVSVLSIVSALLFLPGPLVILIVFTHTLMLLFYMALRREILLDTFTVCSTVVALFGLSLVLDVFHQQPTGNFIGMGLSFLAALATVSRLYIYGHQTKVRNPVVVGAENFLLAACFVLPSALVSKPQVATSLAGNLDALLACASLSLGTFGMFYGISILGSFRWSLFSKLEPVFTSVFSMLLLGEILKAQQYTGMLIVVGSLAFYQFIDQKRHASRL